MPATAPQAYIKSETYVKREPQEPNKALLHGILSQHHAAALIASYTASNTGNTTLCRPSMFENHKTLLFLFIYFLKLVNIIYYFRLNFIYSFKYFIFQKARQNFGQI